MHGADLLRCQRLAEQVNRRHLAAEDPLLIQFGRGANITLVKGLQRQRQIEIEIPLVISYTHKASRLLTSFVETNQAISVDDAS